MNRHGVSIGGFTKQTLRDYHIVRFINKSDIHFCQKGTFLVGSIKRNKIFFDERGDKGEISVTISWKNEVAERWHFTDKECRTYLGVSVEYMAKLSGISDYKKLSSVNGTGAIRIENNPLMNGNMLSLSLSLIPRNITTQAKEECVQKIKNSIGMPNDAVLLELKKPDALIKSATRKIIESGCLEVCVTPLYGKVNYDDRIVVAGSFEDFKKYIIEYYHSETIHVDYLFMKTSRYSDENEIRVMWFGHNNKDENVFSPPIVPYNFEGDHVIVNGIDYEEYFTIGI